MKNEDSFIELIELFNKITNKFEFIKNRPLQNKEGNLCSSEINALNTIASNDSINISQLGKRLGITKSASSQLAKKLFNKGLISRHIIDNNKKNINLMLTKMGMKAVNDYYEMKKEMFKDMPDEFTKFSDSEIDFIKYLFILIDKYLDKKINKYFNLD